MRKRETKKINGKQRRKTNKNRKEKNLKQNRNCTTGCRGSNEFPQRISICFSACCRYFSAANRKFQTRKSDKVLREMIAADSSFLVKQQQKSLQKLFNEKEHRCCVNKVKL